jgi:DNA-binding transcriptional LysR family regulator
MWRSVELREIRIFLVLAEELHFGRTAVRTGLTQSRVSQSMRDLERKLGVQLADRTSRRVALTAAGERFRAEAAATLAGLEAVLRTTEESAADVTYPLRIGVVSAAAVGDRLRQIVAAYEQAHPRSPVQYVGLPFADRFGPLRRGEVELIMSSLPLKQADLVTGPVLSSEPRMLAVGRIHPLASRETVSIEDLADHAIGDLSIAAPPELAEHMAPRTTPSGQTIPRVAVDATEPSALIMAVAQGRVVQPVTRQFAVSYAHRDVSFIPIRDLPPSQSVMVWRRRDRSKALRAFLKIARSL